MRDCNIDLAGWEQTVLDRVSWRHAVQQGVKADENQTELAAERARVKGVQTPQDRRGEHIGATCLIAFASFEPSRAGNFSTHKEV